MILGGISKEPKLAPLAHNVLLLNLKTETSMPEKLAGREILYKTSLLAIDFDDKLYR